MDGEELATVSKELPAFESGSRQQAWTGKSGFNSAWWIMQAARSMLSVSWGLQRDRRKQTPGSPRYDLLGSYLLFCPEKIRIPFFFYKL